jgi:23S rRNA pseudouridine2605 synthase
VSAPRRPDKPGGRPSASSRPRAGGKPARPRKDEGAGERTARQERDEREKPAKAPRVRKDGSVASGRAADRRARTDGEPAPQREARPGRGTRGAARKPDDTRPERPTRARKEAAGASGRSSERRPRAEGGAQPASRGERPARSAPRQADDRRTQAPSRDRNRDAPTGEARADRAPAPRREGAPPRPPRAAAAAARPEAAKPAKAPRVRKDGSVAVRSAAGEGHGRREPQRIAKLLARAGVASRREIERMIEDRRIALNGAVLETPATILTSLAGVTVDGQPVAAPEASRLFLFHKPSGVLTAERDFSGRPTIYDRLPEDLPRVVPIGRLDLNTEGLLLLTNDGELKRKLELPSSGIPRIYRARAYGEVSQEELEGLSEGIEIDGVRYGSIDANMERRTGRNLWIEMKLTEGKNREVRRVLEYFGLQVSRLIRVAYGPFILADLPSGEVGEVKQHELVEFRKSLK